MPSYRMYVYPFLTTILFLSVLLAQHRTVFAKESPVKIALISKTNSTFFSDAWKGCERQASKESKKREIKISCDFISPDSQFEDEAATRQQIEILESIIANKTYDGVAISINGVKELTPIVNKVVEAGIPVITFDSDASDSLRHGYVGTNNTAFGRQLAKVLLKLRPGGGSFGIITSLQAKNVAERIKGFRDRLENTKWVESNASPKDGKGNPLVSLEVMGEMVLEDPSLDAIIPAAMWPMTNSSGWKEFVSAHKNVTYVVGDSSQDQYRLLSHGYGDGLIGQMPFEMGVVSLASLVSILLDDILPSEEMHITHILQILVVPLLLPDLVINNNYLGHLKILGYTLFCIVTITGLVFVSWTWRNKKSRVVTASQPLFLYLIVAGTIIFGSSIITFSIDDETHSIAGCSIACTFNVWFLSIGFTIIFAALYSKAWRVNIIMRESSRFKRVKVMPKDVILPFVALLVVNVIILTTWTIQDRHEYKRFVHPGTDDWNRDFSFYGRCTSLHAEIYFSLILVVNMIALILALYETYKTRHLRTEFNESAYIGVVFISILQAAVIGIPVAAVTSDQPRIAIPVIQVIIFFTCMATLLFMFVPKIVSHRKKKGKKNNGRGTFTQQYLEKLRLENADMNQFSSRKLAHGHHSGLAIRKFEPRLITSMGPAEMMTKEEHLDDNNKKVAFVRGRHLFAKNVESS